MDIRGRTTVYFEDPFWVAVCEVSEGGKLRAALDFEARIYDNK